MADHTLYLQRTLWKRGKENAWEAKVTWLLTSVLTTNRVHLQGWSVRREEMEPILTKEGSTVWRVRLIFHKRLQNRNSTEEQQFLEIRRALQEGGCSSKFSPNPAAVMDQAEIEDVILELPQERAVKFHGDILVPRVLVEGSDEEVEAHEAIEGIYGRASHLRTIFNALDAALRSDFQILNHVLLEGPPGSAKSTMAVALKRVLGEGGYHEFNCASLTAAGLQKLFLKDYRDPIRPNRANCPPVLIFEEAEVLSEDCAEILLKLTDAAHEIRKTTNLGDDWVRADCFCVGLINDRDRFEKLAKGALNRRFTRKIFVPLPDRQLIERIVRREVDRLKGDPRWVEAVLELMEKTHSRDTTEIISWLEGRDRLLHPQYGHDIMLTRRNGFGGSSSVLEALDNL